jgi:hypothetical protein
MQETAERSGVPGDGSLSRGWETAPSPTTSSFAGLLAALTAPAPKPMPAWNDDDLADDVATLSYERALRTHARYKQADPGDWALTQVADSGPLNADEALQADSAPAAPTATLPAEPDWSKDAEPKVTHGLSAMLDPNRKCASITIRLSKAESEQLRRRSAEAGLTVSAYLRSCTFEAEALRAQVKETLAELRRATSIGREGATKQAAHNMVRRSWFEWLLRLMPHWQTGHRVART